MANLTKHARARRYLQASMESGYANMPAEHVRAKQQLMAAHERAYPRVREHALAGADQDFDQPLHPGEREHQSHLRQHEGLQHSDVLGIRRELRTGAAEPPPRSSSAPSRRNSGIGAGPRAARSAGGPIGAAISGSGSMFLQVIGLMLGLSLIYLLVAGKGSQAITGVVGVVTGGVRAFVAPVDPIATAERALGAQPINAAGGASTTTASSPNPGSAKGVDGGFFAPGQSVGLRRKDAGRDVQLQPGAAIVAPGAGEVVRVASDPSGFGPDYPIERFTSGPYAGREIYLGHTDTALPAGAKFKLGQILARTSRTGHNAPPGWAEIGYAHAGVPGHVGQRSPF